MPADPAEPGKGFFGWLGRQVGHVRKAVRTDVTKAGLQPSPKVLYQNTTVEEVPDPRDPNVKLRRTIVDEAVQDDS
jgi:hypothetical protein